MMTLKELKLAGTQACSVLLCVSLLSALLPAPHGALIPTEESRESLPTPRDTSDVIMQADAEEVFYNVDIQKYNDLNITCPRAVPPERGYIVGDGVRVGTIVYVRCHSGYTLHGPTVMACMPSGETAANWSPDVPRECWEGSQREAEDEEQSDSETQDTFSTFFDQSMIKGGSDPPSLVPGSQYWESQRKHMEKKQEGGATHLPPACQLRPSAGPCREAYSRYYFDPASMECRSFVYSGCQGNENNFRTMEQCNERCLNRE